MKSSAMLDHGSPTSMKTPKASLPISRTNGPNYERPERARTSHACEPCRERKTKCDGERPSCRRCSHTGTNCHYGYGKGWRKRKTAEDLSATSKRLQRYEALLNDISTLVSPEVRAMIDDVRQQEPSNHAGSEGAESTTSSISSSMTPSTGMDRERSGSGPISRLPLPLSLAGSLGPTPPGRPQPLPFDHLSESTSPHLAHHPKRDTSFDEIAGNRLPSITPNGMLIEKDSRDTSPSYPRPGSSATHATSDPFMPATGLSYGADSPVKQADGWTRTSTSSVFGLSHMSDTTSSYPLPATHIRA